ncbi:transcription termination/antitermination protein NusA [Longimonas halophila]|uniref:Transcription termination/antitermination protein NusA n=1 Tax=Longimonas halophila TaxID=1469170 RepID=A0A2H3P9B8_9BACT|nr:transcription termination factor NusA [Longimonas halophila]PEN09515.1 transcription termination/antitermination protein NusA [Longimonas halophila]
MRSADLVSSFGEIARVKDIDRATLQIIVEDVIKAMIQKRYGADEAFEIIFNPNQGDIQILHIQEVVDDWDLVDPVTEIELSDARTVDPDLEVGEEVASEMNIEEFGRRAVMTARQTFQQRIRDIEKEQIYKEYSEMIGEIVVGEIRQIRRHETLLVHDDSVEMVLPRREQIPDERHRKGDMLRAVVKEVRRDSGSDPQVVVSRAAETFMERLFELEVPEVYDGIVEIKKVARIPGDRAKVAVTSHDERVDPVGACVGVKGVRIHAVVRELNDENIDVMEWSDDAHTLIKRALSPAEPVSVKINEDVDPPRARAEVVADEVSQAIGRKGVNIKLAVKLTGYEIDVYREIPADEEDIEIEEFADELDPEVIEQLKEIGCDTGKAVLELSSGALTRRTGMNRSTADHVIEVIRTEFQRGPTVPDFLAEGAFQVEAMEASAVDSVPVDEGAEPMAEPAAPQSPPDSDANVDEDDAEAEEEPEAEEAPDASVDPETRPDPSAPGMQVDRE